YDATGWGERGDERGRGSEAQVVVEVVVGVLVAGQDQETRRAAQALLGRGRIADRYVVRAVDEGRAEPGREIEVRKAGALHVNDLLPSMVAHGEHVGDPGIPVDQEDGAGVVVRVGAED